MSCFINLSTNNSIIKWKMKDPKQELSLQIWLQHILRLCLPYSQKNLINLCCFLWLGLPMWISYQSFKVYLKVDNNAKHRFWSLFIGSHFQTPQYCCSSKTFHLHTSSIKSLLIFLVSHSCLLSPWVLQAPWYYERRYYLFPWTDLTQHFY